MKCEARLKTGVLGDLGHFQDQLPSCRRPILCWKGHVGFHDPAQVANALETQTVNLQYCQISLPHGEYVMVTVMIYMILILQLCLDQKTQCGLLSCGIGGDVHVKTPDSQDVVPKRSNVRPVPIPQDGSTHLEVS